MSQRKYHRGASTYLVQSRRIFIARDLYIGFQHARGWGEQEIIEAQREYGRETLVHPSTKIIGIE